MENPWNFILSKLYEPWMRGKKKKKNLCLSLCLEFSVCLPFSMTLPACLSDSVSVSVYVAFVTTCCDSQ